MLQFFIVSVLEWIALLSFPIALVGYRYRKYIIPIIIISLLMSAVSMFLHTTELKLPIIIGIQMLVLLFLVHWLFKEKIYESLFISTIAYGFYVLIFLIIVEGVLLYLNANYFEVFQTNLIFILQLSSFTFVGILSFILYKTNFHLEEFFQSIKTIHQNKEMKVVIVINAVLTLSFICLAAYAIGFVEIRVRYAYVLSSIIVLFLILLTYFTIHLQFKTKRINEIKKFYLEQENQVATVVKKLRTDYEEKFKMMMKLQERGNLQTSKEIFESYLFPNQMTRENENISLELKQHDDLLYALLINKRKLANLLGVSLSVTSEIGSNKLPITIRQVRYLGSILDEIIFCLFQNGYTQGEKTIQFYVRVTNLELQYNIKSTCFLNVNSNTKIQDALLHFQENNATVNLESEPFTLTIIYRFPTRGGGL